MTALWQPLLDMRRTPTPWDASTQHAQQNHAPTLDRLNRPLQELRLSVTDRCNFRCGYCMPREAFAKHQFLTSPQLLSNAEIVRLARIAVQLGVRKLRLTGGEPLLRRDLPELIAQLAALRQPSGQAPELCLTTNGTRLAQMAPDLKAAGLNRVTVSLDAIHDAEFARMTDTPVTVQTVLNGIAAAQTAGLHQGLKVNMVVQRGVNDAQVLPMARHFRGQGVALRFIEYMDVGSSNGWRMDQVVPSAHLLALLQNEFELTPIASQPGETAQRWAHLNSNADQQHVDEIGFISAISQAFCSTCTRARLSADGQLFSCLFAHSGLNLKHIMRSGATDAELTQVVTQFWSQREDRYSQERSLQTAHPRPRIEMSYIGG